MLLAGIINTPQLRPMLPLFLLHICYEACVIGIKAQGILIFHVSISTHVPDLTFSMGENVESGRS